MDQLEVALSPNISNIVICFHKTPSLCHIRFSGRGHKDYKGSLNSCCVYCLTVPKIFSSFARNSFNNFMKANCRKVVQKVAQSMLNH